jgi:UDP-glucose 4-epimerase
MAILITGAGMVGSLAAARLIADYQEQPVLYDVGFSLDNLRERVTLDRVTLVRGDINDLPDLIHTIRKYEVDRVLHTAAFLTWMVRERPYAGVRINFVGVLSVLEAARLTGVKRVVHCSSSTVGFGAKAAASLAAMPEDFSLHAVSEYPPSVYASTKLAGEWLGHCYRNEYGVDFAAVRFGGVFGPWRGTPSGGPSQTMQNLIEHTWRGEPVRITEAETKRAMDYVYAADCAQGAVRALMAERLGQPVYNISMGRNYPFPEVVGIVEEYSGRQVTLDVQGTTNTGYDVALPPADTSKARADLGWQLEFPMERAVRDYMSWLDRTATRP